MTSGPLDEVATASGRSALVVPRYEVLPFGSVVEQAAELTDPVRLTVTTSPKHGIDRSLDFAERLRALGHAVTLHVAARMVKGEPHLNEILERAKELEIDDLFVIGGDAPEPLGPYTAAGELLDVLVEHPLRPATIGIGAYPEGHPLIPQAALDAALEQKARVADYFATQLCFDTTVLLSWLEGVRARGIDLPVYVGATGPIERRRLLDISLKIGVGPSLRFLRKQRGIMARLFSSPTASATRFHDETAPYVGDPRYGIAGFHFFTFNELVGTWRWQQEWSANGGSTSRRPPWRSRLRAR